jgi:hypothetical protein
MALKFGNDDDASDKLAMMARTAGVRLLARSSWGRQFLCWYWLPPVIRRKVRAVTRGAREIIKSANVRLRGY